MGAIAKIDKSTPFFNAMKRNLQMSSYEFNQWLCVEKVGAKSQTRLEMYSEMKEKKQMKQEMKQHMARNQHVPKQTPAKMPEGRRYESAAFQNDDWLKHETKLYQNPRSMD